MLTQRWTAQARIAAQELAESEAELERLRQQRAALRERIDQIVMAALTT